MSVRLRVLTLGSSLKKLMCFIPKVAKSKCREPSAFSTLFHLQPYTAGGTDDFVSFRKSSSARRHSQTKTVVAGFLAHEMMSWLSSEKHTAWIPPTGSTGSVGFSGFSGLWTSC